jgi:hypothetical protein
MTSAARSRYGLLRDLLGGLRKESLTEVAEELLGGVLGDALGEVRRGILGGSLAET